MVGLGLSQEDIWNALEEVKDPEIPILSIIDLKIVRSVEIRDDAVTVQITPTFVGCPALDMIAGAIQDVLIAKGIKTVNVRKDFALQWPAPGLLDLSEPSGRRAGSGRHDLVPGRACRGARRRPPL